VGTLFLIFAVVGGALLALQMLLMAFGVDDPMDVTLGEGLNLLSIRAIVAALTFFGVGGLLAGALGLPTVLSLIVALGTGLAAAAGVAWMNASLHRLESDGTVHVESAIGLPATVYLRVPGGREGAGKVMLQLNGRTVEYQAISAAELPTGAPVVVVDVISPDTVEVAPPHYLGGSSDVG
jgi:hypothetical protein